MENCFKKVNAKLANEREKLIYQPYSPFSKGKDSCTNFTGKNVAWAIYTLSFKTTVAPLKDLITLWPIDYLTLLENGLFTKERLVYTYLPLIQSVYTNFYTKLEFCLYMLFRKFSSTNFVIYESYEDEFLNLFSGFLLNKVFFFDMWPPYGMCAFQARSLQQTNMQPLGFWKWKYCELADHKGLNRK